MNPMNRKMTAVNSAIRFGGERNMSKNGDWEMEASFSLIIVKRMTAIVNRLAKRIIIMRVLDISFLKKEAERMQVSTNAVSEKMKQRAVTGFIGIHSGEMLFKNGKLNIHPTRSSRLIIETTIMDNQKTK